MTVHVKRRPHIDVFTLCGMETRAPCFGEFEAPEQLAKIHMVCRTCLTELKNSRVDDALEKVATRRPIFSDT